jgi:hypothetical protein
MRSEVAGRECQGKNGQGKNGKGKNGQGKNSKGKNWNSNKGIRIASQKVAQRDRPNIKATTSCRKKGKGNTESR